MFQIWDHATTDKYDQQCNANVHFPVWNFDLPLKKISVLKYKDLRGCVEHIFL